MAKTKYEEDLFQGRYARAGNEKDWNDVFKRVTNYVTDDPDRQELYYDLMVSALFIPGSPQLWNYGVPGEETGSSCYTCEIDDTLESIWLADLTARDIYKASGGSGFNLSKIRPRGSKIGNSPNPSVGIMSVVERLNLTTKYITAGGRSRGALMVQLDVSHPDIIEFILAKRPISRNNTEFDLPLTQCNMSVRCSDKFMQAVKQDKEWILYWNNEHQEAGNPTQFFSMETWEKYKGVWKQTLNEAADPQGAFFYYKTLLPAIQNFSGIITAKQIWNLIINNAWNHADPGIVFSDELERRNTTPSAGLCTSNPCFEFIAPPNDACNLGSINLTEFGALSIQGEVNQLVNTVEAAVWYLNESLNVNKIPIESIDKGNKASRRIGLGVMGLHDYLLLNNLAYDSSQGRSRAALLMALIESAGWHTSYQIAEKTGWHAKVDNSVLTRRFGEHADRCHLYFKDEGGRLWSHLRESFNTLKSYAEQGKPVANASITSIAPTGTISQIAGFIKGHQGVSSGIEPIYDWKLQRRDHNGIVEINHWTAEIAKEKNLTETANQISWKNHVKMLAAISQFTSLSVSKTINLPESATEEDVSDAYWLAWTLGIPGTTVYRNNSKPFQVLSSTSDLKAIEVPTSPLNEQPVSSHTLVSKSRPDSLQGFTMKVPVHLGESNRNIYITVNESDGKPYEVFFAGLNKDDLQDGVARELATVGRLVSMAMRYGVPVEEIIDQLEKIDGQHLFSLPTKLAKILSRFVDIDSEGNARLHCKQCGKVTPHQMVDGCKTCKTCGYSAC